MYAIIYDDWDPLKPKKEVISVHKSRETAERTLEKHMRSLGRWIEDCNARIVWVKGSVRAGHYLTMPDFQTWRPGETVSEGELYF